MSLSSNKQVCEETPDAVVCHANYAALQAGRSVYNSRVESRMALWVKSGSGTIIINGVRRETRAGDYFFLPWAHRVEYVPDRRHPFLLAGIHIIPCHSRAHPVEFVVAHNPGHPLANCPWRRDADKFPVRGLLHMRLQEDAPLWLFSEYIVQRHIVGGKQEAFMRELAVLYMRELWLTVQAGNKQETRRSDADFERLSAHVGANLGARIPVGALAAVLDCSESTLGRLVREHTRMSPVNWVNHLRIQQARTLLATTRLPVAKVGERVGVADPFYFSKLFRKHTGLSPLAYRKSTPLL